MIDILGITLDIFRFYAPLVLGATYVVGYERKKLDNLLKFFVLVINIYLVQQVI